MHQPAATVPAGSYCSSQQLLQQPAAIAEANAAASKQCSSQKLLQQPAAALIAHAGCCISFWLLH